LNFLIEQAVEVESPQPAEIKVYDYYEQELIVTKVWSAILMIDNKISSAKLFIDYILLQSYGLEEITCIREMLPEPVPIDEPVLEVIDLVKTDQAMFVSSGEINYIVYYKQ
jgi:hypothetical protein